MSMSAKIESGSFKTAEDSDGAYIECVTSGHFSFPQPHAYGTFEFTVYTGSQIFVNFIAQARDDAYNSSAGGYCFRMYPTGNNIYLYKSDLVATTLRYVLNGYNDDSWYDVKITRELSGEFNVYLKSPTDTNYPTWTLIMNKTDNTYVSSKFLVTKLYTPTKIKNMIHRVGVEV